MNFEIIWSDFAERQLDEIFEYYVENASLKVAKNLLQKLLAEPNKIMDNPEMLQIEELLIARQDEYRYIV
ncbi:type II toxin-antitoxin system RelE/ParE family toxin [Flavobacterium cellulosilyticum]|uniref:type II toxin-antitoxin system RelE/ParE family toxin n=1 Tax=Flavobacterium cellulosilyticum TaxID=2541731 RepID=UPI001FEC0603|nr:type II toxin-antitoxin system RelE/ParE family toxin [Flavobacterium cellulosilyticum]